MSFRLFIYYCALCGGLGAFLGWAIGRWATGNIHSPVLIDGLKGLFLGFGIALLLGFLDAVWNVSLANVFGVFIRVLMAVLIGSAGGLLGGMIANLLYKTWSYLLVVGWTFTGLLIGLSPGVFDLLAALAKNQETRGPLRKTFNGLIGGACGGLLGGLLYALMKDRLQSLFAEKPEERLWTPSSWGFVVLGMCIGLLIGLAQVILKEAWVKVEAGFRKGRELILSKPAVTIGRAEACDIGLFGDAQLEKVHCRIMRRGNDYILTDEGTATGTFVNDERVNGARLLRSGDLIRLGRSVLRFGERAKK